MVLRELAAMIRFSPKQSTSSSPGTPKKVIKTLSNFCQVCDCDSNQKAAVVVYFNVRLCSELPRILSRYVESTESQRICRKCKQRVESAVKKEEAAEKVSRELKFRYVESSHQALKWQAELSRIRLKRRAKQSPSCGDLRERKQF